MKKLSVMFLMVVIILSLSACTGKTYSAPAGFEVMPGYSATEGDFLGRSHYDTETGVLGNFYSLESIDKEDMVLYREVSPYSEQTIIYCDPALEDPFTIYPVKKIEIVNYKHIISVEEYTPTVVSDPKTIDSLVSLKQKATTQIDNQEKRTKLAVCRFFFDLACELIWDCVIEIDQNGCIYFQCENAETKEVVIYKSIESKGTMITDLIA